MCAARSCVRSWMSASSARSSTTGVSVSRDKSHAPGRRLSGASSCMGLRQQECQLSGRHFDVQKLADAIKQLVDLERLLHEVVGPGQLELIDLVLLNHT